MAGFDLQDLVDGMSARMQQERAETQMTLGKLIEVLEVMPNAEVPNLEAAHSYRGYYSDLAFERGVGTRPAADILAECRGAMGRAFTGYKGGDFVMGELTPVWIAAYGSCGEKLTGLDQDEVRTEPDDGSAFDGRCECCTAPWPCPTIHLADELAEARAEIERQETERLRLVRANEGWHQRVSELKTTERFQADENTRLLEALDRARARHRRQRCAGTVERVCDHPPRA